RRQRGHSARARLAVTTITREFPFWTIFSGRMAVGSASSVAGRISLRGGVLAYDSMEACLYVRPNCTPRLSHERHDINAAVLLMAQGSGLLIPQSDQRVDSRRSPRGHVAGEHRDEREQQHDGHEGRWVGGAHPV